MSQENPIAGPMKEPQWPVQQIEAGTELQLNTIDVHSEFAKELERIPQAKGIVDVTGGIKFLEGNAAEGESSLSHTGFYIPSGFWKKKG